MVCPAGEGWVTAVKACVACDPGLVSTSTEKYCSECTGLGLIADGSATSCVCDTLGHFVFTTSCVCDASNHWVLDGVTFDSCECPAGSTDVDGVCEQDACPTGEGWVTANKQCQPCSLTEASSDTEKTCTACSSVDGFEPNDNFSECVCNSDAGFATDGPGSCACVCPGGGCFSREGISPATTNC